ncbi:hypothetical protein HOY80DRAFT_1053087 [Tuber brumale]|nr:hypothetical protein HOY80DRAFT_1053087 [Tuber brumale]
MCANALLALAGLLGVSEGLSVNDVGPDCTQLCSEDDKYYKTQSLPHIWAPAKVCLIGVTHAATSSGCRRILASDHER